MIRLVASVPGSFEKLPGERVSDVRVRHDTFTSCWTAVKEKIAVSETSSAM